MWYNTRQNRHAGQGFHVHYHFMQFHVVNYFVWCPGCNAYSIGSGFPRRNSLQYITQQSSQPVWYGRIRHVGQGCHVHYGNSSSCQWSYMSSRMQYLWDFTLKLDEDIPKQNSLQYKKNGLAKSCDTPGQNRHVDQGCHVQVAHHQKNLAQPYFANWRCFLHWCWPRKFD